jgi:hypothetical protein
MYVYVHISLFLPECVCTTIIHISPRTFSLMYCCCVSIIIVICICSPGALIWLINLFLFLLLGDSSPICKRHPESMLKGIKSYLCLVQTGHVDIEEFRCGRKGERHTTCNIVWNMERDHSFWITSSEHQGTMPKRIFSFSCSMQVIQFADLQFHLIK